MDSNLNEKFQLAMPVFDSINDHYIQCDKCERAIKSVNVNKEMYDKKSGLSLFITNYSIKIAAVSAVILLLTIITDNKGLISVLAFFAAVICGLTFFSYKAGELPFAVATPPAVGFEQQISSLRNQITAEENAIRTTYMENKELIESFPPDYRYSHAINSIYKILVNGRADTLKEALNVFETDEYQRKMLGNMQDMVRLEQQQVELMQRMAEAQDVMKEQIYLMSLSGNGLYD